MNVRSRYWDLGIERGKSGDPGNNYGEENNLSPRSMRLSPKDCGWGVETGWKNHAEEGLKKTGTLQRGNKHFRLRPTGGRGVEKGVKGKKPRKKMKPSCARVNKFCSTTSTSGRVRSRGGDLEKHFGGGYFRGGRRRKVSVGGREEG